MKTLLVFLLFTLTGCATYHRSWQLPFRATNRQLQAYACYRYGSLSDRKLRNGFCSGYSALAQVGDEDGLTIVGDVRRGAKGTWLRFDECGFKAWLKEREAKEQDAR